MRADVVDCGAEAGHAELPKPQPACGVVRILLGAQGKPRCCLVVPAGSLVAVDLAAWEMARAASSRLPNDFLSLYHVSTVTTPSDVRDWNAVWGFQAEQGP